MNIVFFAHPAFLKLKSMDKYTQMLVQGMAERGHNTQVWLPVARFSKLPLGNFLRKWMGYVDAYLVFPFSVKYRLRTNHDDTLFVFIDQALGPWLPLVKGKAHMVHCHDLLALRSANGDFPENITGWTGKQYQKFILRGYKKGENFISVSYETRNQLERHIGVPSGCNSVVYNGINRVFTIINSETARSYIEEHTQIFTQSGYIVHVGGNQWYKNRAGVIAIYNAWRIIDELAIPLLLIGEQPSKELLMLAAQSPYSKDIYFLAGKSDDFIRNAYSGASVLLYPSIAEGFGWPIAEAMSCGCLVITTGQAPMTEVGGTAAFYINRRPTSDFSNKGEEWATESAVTLQEVIHLPENRKAAAIANGLQQVNKFDASKALDQIERFYLGIPHKQE
jgi:glycosyltransferase involved in cell wall biosynthesis